MLKTMTYSALGLIIEFVKLFPVMYIVLQFKTIRLKNIIMYFAAALTLTCVLSLSHVNDAIPTNSFICVILTILILKGKTKTLYTVIAYLGICMLDMLSASVVLLFTDHNFDTLIANDLAHVISFLKYINYCSYNGYFSFVPKIRALLFGAKSKHFLFVAYIA